MFVFIPVRYSALDMNKNLDLLKSSVFWLLDEMTKCKILAITYKNPPCNPDEFESIVDQMKEAGELVDEIELRKLKT